MSNTKISQLSSAAALDGTEEVPIVQSGETVKTTTQDIADLGGGGSLGYSVYKASMSQSGTSNPTVNVFENTIGGASETWTRTATGDYYTDTTVAFDVSKIFLPFNGLPANNTAQYAFFNDEGLPSALLQYRFSDNGGNLRITINFFDGAGNPQDISSGDGTIYLPEIQVYP